MARIRSVKPEPYKKTAIPGASRRALAERLGAGGESERELFPACCAQCGAEGAIYWPLLTGSKKGHRGAWVNFPDLEIDHVVPESKGGSHDPDNLQLLCRPCNRRKAAKV